MDLCRRKGLDPSEAQAFDPEAYKQRQYDKLAKGVREGLDMEFVYKILERKV